MARQTEQQYVEADDDPLDTPERIGEIARACDLREAGRPEEASKLFAKLHPAAIDAGEAGPAAWCETIGMLRQRCTLRSQPRNKQPVVQLGRMPDDYDDEEPEMDYLCAHLGRGPARDAGNR